MLIGALSWNGTSSIGILLMAALLGAPPLASSFGAERQSPSTQDPTARTADHTSSGPTACGRLRADVRSLVCADGSLFRWRGVTAFRLVDLIADGREAEAVRYLDWADRSGFNVVRVLATLCCWFDLPPPAGQKALPRLLALAGQRGMYVQIVALAGTAPHERSIDLEAQVKAVGEIAAAHEHAIVEIANEPEHSTQDKRLHDLAYVDRLAALVPAEVLTIGGSARVDHAVTSPLGDLVTRHLSRLDNPWEMMQRVRGLDHVAQATARPVLSGEPFGAGETRVPGTRETDPDLFFTYGALCRVFELSCNFHLEAGLNAVQPGPIQQAAADAFIAGSQAVPDDWRLTFRDLGSPESPISRAHLGRARAVYSGLAGNEGLTVAFGVRGDLELQWRGYQPTATLRDRPAVKAWRIRRVDFP
ncbi:MAG TPA: hypothetical protein VES67_00110 [Vicinamibacterales bacterium]|nr:hypothetical protein [Vicinamibacterales bacterium]